MGNCVKTPSKKDLIGRGNTTFTSNKSETLVSNPEKKLSFTKSMKSFFGGRTSRVEHSDTNDTDSLKNAILTITYSDQKDNMRFERPTVNPRSLSIFPYRNNKTQKSSYKEDTHFMKGNSIGRGLYGIVYNCLDAETGEIMALKIVSSSII